MTPLTVVCVFFIAAPVAGVGLLELQARLERWDQRRHAGPVATITLNRPDQFYTIVLAIPDEIGAAGGLAEQDPSHVITP